MEEVLCKVNGMLIQKNQRHALFNGFEKRRKNTKNISKRFFLCNYYIVYYYIIYNDKNLLQVPPKT